MWCKRKRVIKGLENFKVSFVTERRANKKGSTMISRCVTFLIGKKLDWKNLSLISNQYELLKNVARD